jgi:alanyl-tRNA synthetase
MTERLYYTDSYLRHFTANVVERAEDGVVYLDRTAFYPSSGGQPFDTGSIAGVRVVEVIDEGARGASGGRGQGGPVECYGRLGGDSITCSSTPGSICSPRCLKNCSAEDCQPLGRRGSTIDLEGRPVEPRMPIEGAPRVIAENRAVSVLFEDAAEVQGLRKASNVREHCGSSRRAPIAARAGDTCPGHRRNRRDPAAEEKDPQSTRVEFLCGGRRRACPRGLRGACQDCAAVSAPSMTSSPWWWRNWNPRALERSSQTRSGSCGLS